jgi:hypothetical protein
MNWFLQTDHYTFYGWGVLWDLFSGKEWSESGNFPRVTYCDMDIRILGLNITNFLSCSDFRKHSEAYGSVRPRNQHFHRENLCNSVGLVSLAYNSLGVQTFVQQAIFTTKMTFSGTQSWQ